MIAVVTDSVADIPNDIAAKLGISVVPLLVRFGEEEYRDGVDLTSESFYERLSTGTELPTTSMSPPGAYTELYDRLARRAEGILVITLSSRLSGTHQVARRAVEQMRTRCRVEIMDSRTATMTEGFIVIRAAEAARAGATLDEAMIVVEQTRRRVDFLCTFDTLEYLQRGGRIGAASAFLGSVLHINPLINLREGVVMPAGRARSRRRAVDRLVEFVAGYSRIEELAVENTACAQEAEELVDRLADWFPAERVLRSTMTPVIGAHTGPGLLLVGVLGDK